jgi:hypothetical protein
LSEKTLAITASGITSPVKSDDEANKSRYRSAIDGRSSCACNRHRDEALRSCCPWT